MQVNPYESPPPPPENLEAQTLQDNRWSLTLTGLFAGGYVGAWVGSIGGGMAGMALAVLVGGDPTGFGNPGFSFVETLITTGLLVTFVGLMTGIGLGATLGIALGSLVAVTGHLLRKAFLWVACLAGSLAAMTLATAMFGFDVRHQEFHAPGGTQPELVARVAVIGVAGIAGLFGGALLGRILREVAWGTGVQVEVVADENDSTTV